LSTIREPDDELALAAERCDVPLKRRHVHIVLALDARHVQDEDLYATRSKGSVIDRR